MDFGFLADANQPLDNIHELLIVDVVQEERGRARMSHDVSMALLQMACREAPVALRGALQPPKHLFENC